MLVTDPGPDPIDGLVIPVQAVIPSRQLGRARRGVGFQAPQQVRQAFVEVIPIDRFVSYHIVNARIVNEGTVTSGDLSVDGGRILGVNVPAPPGADVIEAAGAYLLPGMIDDQVHFREPGLARPLDLEP